LTGVTVSKRSLEQILPDAAQDFDAFYRHRSPNPATGSVLVAAVDCKGIPMVKPPGSWLRRAWSSRCRESFGLARAMISP
jgi:hypothetical protein